MKGNFKILKLNNEPYDFLVIVTSYENPLSSIKEIGKEIQVRKANLLFDLTLINGTNKNRYIKCEYDADTNQLPLCSIVESVDDDIKKVSQSYFSKNEEVVKKKCNFKFIKVFIEIGYGLIRRIKNESKRHD